MATLHFGAVPNDDWLPDFILPLVGACAWPVTVLVLAWLFRHEMGRVLGRLIQVKYKGVEANFSSELREAQKRAPSVSSEEEPPKREPPHLEMTYGQIRDRLVRFIDVSPQAAIAEAWGYVEQATRGAARHLHTEAPGYIDEHRAIVEALVEKGPFNRSATEQFDRLRRLRNDAVHSLGFSINADEAERYVDVALRLASDIEDGAAVVGFERRSTTIE